MQYAFNEMQKGNHLNKILDNDRCECQYQGPMDIWNKHHASIINEMLENEQENDEQYNIQDK